MDFLQYALDELEKIKAEHQKVYYHPPTDESPNLWVSQETIEYPQEITLEHARQEIDKRLKAHLTSEYDILLLAAPAGVGKTHAGVTLAQDLARQGKRVFWASPAHYLFSDVEKMPHFDSSLWYHWQGMGGMIDNEEACIEFDNQSKWLNAGYPSLGLCRSLCLPNGHFHQCKYRRQRFTKSPIIFGMHNHLTMGLPIENFDVFIIDELPLSHFIDEQFIPKDKMHVQNMPKLTRDLINRLVTICNTTERVLHSNELMEEIIDWLDPLTPHIKIRDLDSIVPVLPKPENLDKLEPFYIPILLVELYREYLAYCDGRKYEGRIQISKSGLKILRKAELWEKLPKKGYILDATANQDIYQYLFNGRTIDTHKPHIKRIGKVYQITKRLNSKTSLSYKDEPSKKLEQVKQDIDLIIQDKQYSDIGIITHLAAKKYFEGFYNPDRILHFYNQRGTNTLIGIDALFVVGAPSPNYETIYKIAQAINEDLEPIENTHYSYKPVQYAISKELYSKIGMQYLENVGGYWGNELLETIHNQYRESELIQSINRARPLSQNVDIWLLTNIPIQAIVDRIYGGLPIGARYNDSYPMAEHWQVIRPLLNQKTISYDDLSRVSGLSVKTIQRRNWYEAIVETYKNWQIVDNPTGGRPKKVIVKI